MEHLDVFEKKIQSFTERDLLLRELSLAVFPFVCQMPQVTVLAACEVSRRTENDRGRFDREAGASSALVFIQE